MFTFYLKRLAILLLICMLKFYAVAQSDTLNAQTHDSDVSARNVNDEPLKVIRLLKGKASYYANKFEGRKTASGEVFSQLKYTAASNKLPLGTQVLVVNPANGECVKVKINDRMNAASVRLIDLSRIAATNLNIISSGVANVIVQVLED